MKNKTKNLGLGRGLDSLLKDKSTFNKEESFKEIDFKPSVSKIFKIRIDHLKRNTKQPRKHFNKEALQDLASSLKEHGLLQPLVVRKIKGSSFFEIIAGERRWRAAQLAELRELPCIIKETNDQKTLEIALIENIQRENLNLIEEAKAYDFLMKKYSLTQESLSQKLGKKRSSIANALRILCLDPFVQNLIFEKKIEFGHAKLLAGIKDKKTQKQFANLVVKKNLSVRDLEKLMNKKVPLSVQKTAQNSIWTVLNQQISEKLSTQVSFSGNKKKGSLKIHFYSEDQLEDLINYLRKF